MEDPVDLRLLDPGPRPIPIYQTMVGLTAMNIKQARKLVDASPVTIISQVPRSQAEGLKVEFEATGASVELGPAGPPGAPTDLLT